MEKNNTKDEYIYINGSRYANQFFQPENEVIETKKTEGSEYYNIDISGLQDTNPQKKMEAAMKIVAQIRNISPNNSFERTDDESIIKIMHGNMFAETSLGKNTLCPICEIVVQPHHFKKHEFIFDRGCVYCDCELKMGDFVNYWQHITQYHDAEVKNYIFK